MNNMLMTFAVAGAFMVGGAVMMAAVLDKTSTTVTDIQRDYLAQTLDAQQEYLDGSAKMIAGYMCPGFDIYDAPEREQMRKITQCSKYGF